ncbi:MAG: biotin synthase BioB [Deltaproteobacteria bacterium]|nr:biotin synthase BioB [Deltaproteobacteria bacterium]
MDWNTLADKALGGEVLSDEECLGVLRAPDEALPDLLEATSRVREHHCGRRVRMKVLINAKSGLCPEDCGYCSQSAVSRAPIARYPLLSGQRLLDAARQAHAARAHTFCIVDSGRKPTDREVDQLAEAARAIKAEVPIRLCFSVGLLTEATARRLRDGGFDRGNHNLNTSERFYDRICSTHTYQDRVATVRAITAAGLSPCCGVIAGMGEEDQDLIDVARALRELHVDSIPVNFLHPIPGTPLGSRPRLTPERCLKILCLFRLLNPSRHIRPAGGREVNLGALQPLALYAASSLFVGGYLTTPGQPPAEAVRMIEEMGFEVDEGNGREP